MMQRLVRKVHLWLGLSLGALFVLLGLTGSVLVFYTEIDRQLNPALAVAAAPPDWDQAVRTLRTAFPNKQGPWRLEVTQDRGAIPARYYNPPETAGRAFAPMMVWLSPDGRHVLRQDFWGDYAMTWIYDLHFSLLAGEIGGAIIGWSGVILLALLVSGVWAWWPRGNWRKALRYKAHAAPTRRLRDQHKWAGLGSALLLLALTGTGAMLALAEETEAVLRATGAPPTQITPPVSRAWEGRQISLGQAIQTAQAALPDARIAWIEVPGPGNAAFRFRLQTPADPSRRFPHSYVWIDQYSGQVLKVADLRSGTAGDVVLAWLHPIHDGSVGGRLTQILAVLSGLAPLLLFVTGWRRYRLRRAS